MEERRREGGRWWGMRDMKYGRWKGAKCEEVQRLKNKWEGKRKVKDRVIISVREEEGKR